MLQHFQWDHGFKLCYCSVCIDAIMLNLISYPKMKGLYCLCLVCGQMVRVFHFSTWQYVTSFGACHKGTCWLLHFFWQDAQYCGLGCWWMVAFVALDLVFPVLAKRLMGKSISEMTYMYLVSSGMSNLNSDSDMQMQQPKFCLIISLHCLSFTVTTMAM